MVLRRELDIALDKKLSILDKAVLRVIASIERGAIISAHNALDLSLIHI